MMKASVIGLGKLGSPLAACLAARGVFVIGVDQDPRKVDAINQGQPPVHEPGLAEMLAQSEGRLTATADIEAAVRDTQISFIVVSTPSDPAGGFSLRYVEPVCQAIGRALAKKPKNEYHLVCLTSTVMPGTTGGPVREMLEKASGKKMGPGNDKDFGLCYSPEFIALGSVIRDFLNPDFVLIGESDVHSGEILENLYKRVCESKPAVARMNFVNAEITKISVNTYVTSKISFANMLARICEGSPGANVDVVTAALGLDSRIGAKYLKGAVSYGGACFSRGKRAVAALARGVGGAAELAQATDNFNRAQVIWLAELVGRHAQPGGAAGILGLTYKPQTDVVEEAVGFLLARELASRGFRVCAFDPAGMANARRELGDAVFFASTVAECIARSEVVVLATPWREFLEVPAADWISGAQGRVVVDCWRGLKHIENVAGIRYLSLGIGMVEK